MRVSAVIWDRSEEWMDKGSTVIVQDRFIVRHKGLPATTAICTCRGSQGMPAPQGKKRVGILLNWWERSCIAVTPSEQSKYRFSWSLTALTRLEVYSWKRFSGIIYSMLQHQHRRMSITLFLTDAYLLTAASSGDSVITSSIPSCLLHCPSNLTVFLIANPNLVTNWGNYFLTLYLQ